MLLFDHGERRSGVPAALERLGVAVHAARLPVGDHVVSDRLVVERKGPTDLAASIKDRSLREQLARLADPYPSVLGTADTHDTGEWLARLYRLEGKPASRPHGGPRLRAPAA